MSTATARLGALWALPLLLMLGTPRVATPVPAVAQTSDELAAFLEAVTHTAHRFTDADAAITAGYRKLGPDFPGMGEHWIHPGLVIRGELDPEHPPVLTYTRVDSVRTLVGVAFTRGLGPDEDPPAGPLPSDAWHDHTGGVDEESLLLSGPPSMHPAGERYRLAMVHIWIPRSNPAGILAQNNWTLPFLRSGLSLDSAPSSAAARALSLAGVGEPFYAQLIEDGVGLRDDALDAAASAFRDAGLRVAAWRNARPTGTPVTASELDTLESVWSELWRTLDARLSAAELESMAVLRR